MRRRTFCGALGGMLSGILSLAMFGQRSVVNLGPFIDTLMQASYVGELTVYDQALGQCRTFKANACGVIYIPPGRFVLNHPQCIDGKVQVIG